jgi:hypothetical protein
MIAKDLFDIVLKIGSLSGLTSLVYLVVQNSRQSPCLQLERHSTTGQHYEANGAHFYRFSWGGYVKNQSLSGNTVTKFMLIVWRDSKKRAALRYGWGGLRMSVGSADAVPIELPIPFEARSAKLLNIVFEIPVIGTSDERLLKEHIEVCPGLYQAVHEYEVCVEDVSGNLFDPSGRYLNRNGIDIRWRLEGCDSSARPLSLLQKLQIARGGVVFRARLLAKRLGLSR